MGIANDDDLTGGDGRTHVDVVGSDPFEDRTVERDDDIGGAAQTSGNADPQMPLVIFGLLVSIPIIVWGSQLVLKLMDRFPMIITAGGMLLGWIAGTMMQTDPGLVDYLPQDKVWGYGMGLAGALLVLALGKIIMTRRPASQEAA